MAIAFEKATRRQGKLRLGLCGPSGSGKTFTALRVATGLCPPGKRIRFVDSERGSASLYAGRFDFDVLELTSFSVDKYLAAILAAEAAPDTGVIIIDSLSHAWAGKGGVLEYVDNLQAAQKNKMSAWREATPVHNSLVDAMLQSSAHIIATMRVKTEWLIEDGEGGKKQPRKVGLAPVQRDGMEYEFTIVADLDQAKLVVSKTRIPEVVPLGAVLREPGEEFGQKLAAWLLDAPPAPARPPSATANGSKAPAQDPVVRKRVKLVWDRLKLHGMSDPEAKTWIAKVLLADKSSTEISAGEADQLETAFERQFEPPPPPAPEDIDLSS